MSTLHRQPTLFRFVFGALFAALLATAVPAELSAADTPFLDRVEHGYADNAGTKIHFAALGAGPLVVMIHGFPDFWYTWRHQMEALATDYRVVAVDLRGYNLSDKPKGVANYAMPLLLGDIAAVIKANGQEKAIIVGHDWGGAISWAFAMNVPQMVDKLIILNLPHPNGMTRELATNEEQQRNSEYARTFQQPDAHKMLNAEGLARWVRDPEARKLYVEAFLRSDFEAMLNYYKANYPSGDVAARWQALQENPGPKVQVPVLQFHGLLDTALHANGVNGTWNWLGKDWTLVTVPGASHFVQQDAPELVSSTMKWWLLARR